MRVAIYARVSTDRQETENQLAELREFSAKMDWQLVGEYVDHESGAKSDRAQFQTLFADASRRKFDVVLFWALDRFTREGTLPTLQYLSRLESYGVGFRSYTEAYLDSTGIFKEVVVALLSTLAKQERLRLSERIRAGLARVRREGKRLGRPAVQVDRTVVRALREGGASWAAISWQLGIARGTLQKAAAR